MAYIGSGPRPSTPQPAPNESFPYRCALLCYEKYCMIATLTREVRKVFLVHDGMKTLIVCVFAWKRKKCVPNCVKMEKVIVCCVIASKWKNLCVIVWKWEKRVAWFRDWTSHGGRPLQKRGLGIRFVELYEKKWRNCLSISHLDLK